MISRGYLRVAMVSGVPVWVHWSVLLVLPASFYYVDLFFAAVVASVSYVFLVLTHEFGHMAMAKWLGCRVVSIQLLVFDGRCFTVLPENEVERALISAGGVIAQVPLFFLGVAAAIPVAGLPPSARDLLAPAVIVFTFFNLVFAVVNLWPRPPFDGYYAWRLIPALVRGDLLRVLRARWSA